VLVGERPASPPAPLGAIAAAWRARGRTAARQARDLGRAGITRSRKWAAANTLQPTWLPPRWRHPAMGYLLAIAGTALAAGLTLGLLMWFPMFRFPSALFLLVTVLIAVSFGAGPSLVAALLGAVLVLYFIVPPGFSLVLRAPADAVSFALYLSIALLISILPSQTARSRDEAQRAQAAARQAQDEAVGRAEQLRITFEAVADAVALYDAELRLLNYNTAFLQLFGYEDEPDIMRWPVERRYAQSSIQDLQGHMVPLDQLPQARALRGEVSVGPGAVDLRMRTRTGRTVEVSATAAPVPGASGAIVGAVAIFRDVTERRRLERRTEEALAALLEMAAVLVASAPSEGPPAPAAAAVEGGDAGQEAASKLSLPARQAAREVAVLTRRVLGCARVAITAVDSATEVMRPLAVVGLTPEEEAHLWATWPEHARLSDSVHQPQIWRLRAGEIVTMDLGEAGPDAPGNPYGARSVLVAPGLLAGELACLLTADYGSEPHVYSPQEQALARGVTQLIALIIERERLIAERAQAEARALALRAATEQMDQFLSVASHELRTPLTSMKLNVQIAAKRARRLLTRVHAAASQPVERAAPDVEALAAALQRAEGAIGRQERLVSDLLDVSRIQSGSLEYRVAPLDVAALAREAVEEQVAAYPERAITLRVPEVPVIVEGDGDRIRQVLANYLTNALRYAPAEQLIAVRVAAEEGAGLVRVSVRDQGPGVAASEQARVWERFHQSPGVSSNGSGVGLGLGLFISREIVARHGGQVGIVSDIGQGAEFWFTLPLAGETGSRS
jgi:PAS domain S-box-containing protein